MRKQEPENYSEYKDRRLEVIRQIDYNKGQISYHKAQLAYLETELEEIQDTYHLWEDKLHEEKHIENKLSIQEVADMLAVDSKRIEDKILTSKAEKLLEQMMKGFK
jgi:hypothetical protein